MDEREERGIVPFLDRELKARGWTREDLCERTGIPLERLDEMPNEIITSYLGELWQIAEVFGLTRMQALGQCVYGNDSGEPPPLVNRSYEVCLGCRPVLYRMVRKSQYLSEEDILQVERRVDALLKAQGIQLPYIAG
jgi:transcriptional regulator with XRE-family HTH domain